MKFNFNPLKQKLLPVAICFFLFTSKSFSQSGVQITYYDATQQNFVVDTTGKLYFDATSVFIVSTNAATPTSIPLSIIRKITFTSATLPLNLVDFSAKSEKDKVYLNWITENEINTAYFIVQKSVNGTEYENIGQVKAANNTSKSNYSFTDEKPQTGVSYYRLKQVDTDGKFTYSKVVSVNRTIAENITLFPNPASNYLVIKGTSTERLDVKVYSATGQLMLKGNYTSGEQIAINKLTPGMYVAMINNKAYKLIKQ